MSDDTSHRGEPDRSRISLGQDYEKQYWMKALGVSEEALTAAVHAVGHSAEKVRDYLHRDRPRR